MPFDAAAAAAIDTEIRAVFAETRIITPDEVRGAHATLEEAVLADGWPTLAAARGRILFFMEGAAVDEYVAGAPGLVGRLVFANSQPGDPHAAVVIVNDAIAGQATIADMVSRGYIVRTMADGSTVQARSGDETPRERRAGERRPDRQHRLLPPRSARQHRRQRLDELQGEAPRRRPGAHQPGQRRRRRSRPHLRIVLPAPRAGSSSCTFVGREVSLRAGRDHRSIKFAARRSGGGDRDVGAARSCRSLQT